MNQSRKIPSKKRIEFLEFTFNADLVKEVIFSCNVEDGEIDWGDGTVELRNNVKITDSENNGKSALIWPFFSNRTWSLKSTRN